METPESLSNKVAGRQENINMELGRHLVRIEPLLHF